MNLQTRQFFNLICLVITIMIKNSNTLQRTYLIYNVTKYKIESKKRYVILYLRVTKTVIQLV